MRTASNSVFPSFKATGLPVWIVLASASLPLGAQTYQTWRAENTQSNWQNATAWWNFPNNSPIVFGQQEWDNNVELSQNSSADVSTWRFLFKSGASSAHTFTGNQISFFDFSGQDPMIINDSGATHIINNNIIGDNTGVDPLLIVINSTGGLTFGGTINNNGNTLNVEGSTSSATTVTFNGTISGGGGLYKDNSNISAVLANTNNYSGQTTINAGILRVNSGGSLGSGDVRIASAGSLELNGSSTIASVAELGSGNSGTIGLGVGATLTINGANKGSLFQNSITGSGNLTMAGSGTTSLGLFGTQSYSGTTTVSGGKISSGVTMGTLSVVVSGGEFEMTADNKLADVAALSISNGTLDLQGTDTVASLSSTGGAVTLGSGKTLTVTANSSIGTGSTITGGTLAATGGTLTFNSASGNSSAVTIGTGAKLTGTGTIGGTTTVNGIHAVGASAAAGVTGSQTISSALNYGSASIFEWDINTGANTSDSVSVVGALDVTAGAVFKVVSTTAFTNAFWDETRNWNVFGGKAFNAFALNFVANGATQNAGDFASRGSFSFTNSGQTLTWTAVPEPSSVLAGGLLAAGLMRRRRQRGV